jgi:hypothetical protein
MLVLCDIQNRVATFRGRDHFMTGRVRFKIYATDRSGEVYVSKSLRSTA